MPVTAQRVPSFAKRSLRKRILKAALKAPEFQTVLDDAAAEIRSFATDDASEATIEGVFERVLYAHLREIGLRFHPTKEADVETKRHITHGRMDSRLGSLVIEYKRPSRLGSSADTQQAIEQLTTYLIALSASSTTPLVGVLTNGKVLIEIRVCAGTIVGQSAAEVLGGSGLLRLTQHFIALALTALTPSNLIRDFCGPNTDGALFQTARILNNILLSPQPKTMMLMAEWEEMFRLAHDDQSQQRRIEDRRQALASLFSIPVSDAEAEYRSLFAIHTAYAIVLKFIAYRTVSDIYLGETSHDYRSLARATDMSLRAFCSKLEDGEVFRALGIVNLLEGDFFSWYCDSAQWTPELAESIRTILGTLARYEEAGHIFEADGASDLFRDLYQASVPRVVRSSFGEFYTPYWLAEHVLESASPSGQWRAIDPCCGSGTFVVAAITRVRRECATRKMNANETLAEILSRIAAIDLNPLGVLTTRINYFIHISSLLIDGATKPPVIPVFLGDAASIPERRSLQGVECLTVELKTLQEPIRAILPVSLVQDTPTFMQRMVDYERKIKARKRDAAKRCLIDGVPSADRCFEIRKAIADLTDNLIALEEKGWNGIWARILSNFLTTACLGRFSVIVGNPPWIDWKNLPEGYRRRIKAMCIERGLFSGAGRTGGINLNICALIAYVAMTNWLESSGRLAFLMPRELANQASYEGWRRLGGRWVFLQFNDWSKAGHPFDPVKEDFMTFVIGSGEPRRSVPVRHFEKRGGRARAAEWTLWPVAEANLEVTDGVAGQIIPNSTAFTFARDQVELDEFSLVTGGCEYIGREGCEFYPQELMLFTFDAIGPRPGTVWLHNIQGQKSKYKIQRQRVLLETTYLFPLVKGPEIARYEHQYSGLIVAFAYDERDPLRPVPVDLLEETSPLLLAYYQTYRDIIEQQTQFSDKIRGLDPGAFYGVARTGPYSFATVWVAYRDNTAWRSVVVSDTEMPWGERKRFVFQNHAVSMCERQQDNIFITADEAHFICAILNTPIVCRFIGATSDNRSFKIRPPVFVPRFDPSDDRHRRLTDYSRAAHTDATHREALGRKSEQVYLSLCGDEALDAMIASDQLAEIDTGEVDLVRGDELRLELERILSE